MDGKHAECRFFGVNGLALFKHGVAASLVALGLALLAGVPALAGTDVWTSNGPYGGQIMALAINPQSPSTLYAGTSGGVFESTDSGATWSAINNGLGNLGVNSLAINSQNPSTLYAGTDGGVYESTDGGANWTAINNGLTNLNVQALAINPQTPSTLYAGTYQGGVFESTDGGATWATVNNGLINTYVWALAINPQNPATLYAGTLGSGVFESTDGGATWAANNSGLLGNVYALAINPQNPTTVYAGTQGGVFESTDGGATWAAMDSGLSYTNVHALAINPQNPTTLYAGTLGGGGVFQSTDGGTTWSVIQNGLSDDSVYSLAINPQNPSTLYAGTLAGGVFQSTDGGATWNAINNGLGHYCNVYSLAINPQTSSTLYAGTYQGGVFESTDGGATWAANNSGLSNTNVYALAINPQNPTTVYAGTDGGVFESTDGGATWNAINSGLSYTNVYALAINPQNPTTLYVGTLWGGVFESTDGGATWAANNSGLSNTNVYALAINPQNPTTVYAGTQGGVFESTDGGATWNASLVWGYVFTLAINPQNPTTVYAGTQGGVFESTDGGATWITVNNGFNGLSSTNVRALVINPQSPTTLYAGTDGGAYESTNGGETWSAINNGLGNLGVLSLAINPQNPTTVYAGTQGGPVFSITLTTTCTLSCTATVPSTGQVNAPISFQSTATPSAGCTGTPTYSWNFGDGGTSTEQNATHAYSTANTYNWTMTASLPSGATCQKTGTITITATPPTTGGLAGTIGIWDGTTMWPLDGSAVKSIAVTLTDLSGNNPRQATVTGASYSITGVPAGTYNVTASIIYIDNVTVSNVANCLGDQGCNASALAKTTTFTVQASVSAASTTHFDLRLPLPIVMLHGVRSCYQMWYSPDVTDQGHWDNYARSHGRIVFTPNYTWYGLAAWSYRADEVVNQVSSDFQSLSHAVTGSSYPPWYIIAHSMGGLVSRVIVSGPSAHDPLVEKLAGIYELGTPNSGSDFWGLAPYTCLSFLDTDSIEGYYDDNHSFQKGFNTDYPNLGTVPVQTFVGSICAPNVAGCIPLPTDFVVSHDSTRHIWRRLETFASDGSVELMVNVDSQGSPLLMTEEEPLPLFHWDEGSPLDLGTLNTILGSTLARAAHGPHSGATHYPATPTQASITSAPQLFTVVNSAVTLPAGEAQTVSFSISGTDSLVVSILWGSSSGTATLISPAGTPVNFSDPSSNEGADYSGGGYSGMSLLNPAPGTWKVSLTSPSGGPAAVFVQEDGVFGLQSAVAQGLLPLGSKAHLVGVWSGDSSLVSGASEAATVYDANGSVVATVPLYDDGQHSDGAPGDGTFGGDTPAISVPGHYTVVLQAEGSYNGVPFMRWASSAFDVQGSSPIFTGQFSDSAVDGNGTGTVDTLQETIGLNLPAAGDFTVVGDLVDSQGYPVAHAVAAVQATVAGAATADLNFFVLGVACGHFSGPLSVTNLRVEDGSSLALLDVWTSTVQTQSYDGAAFGCNSSQNVGPTINGLSPNVAMPGQTKNVVVSGTGFQNGCTVAFSGSGVSSGTVQWLEDGALVVSTQVASSAAPGSYDVTITNPDGKSVTGSGLFIVAADQPPTVTFTSPSDGQTVQGTVIVSASAADDGSVSEVDFFVDGTQTAAVSAFPYRFTWDTTLVTPGQHTLTAAATDDAGLGSQATITVTVSQASTPLSVTVSAQPSSGPPPLAVTLNAIASGGTPPYTYTWNFGDGSGAATGRQVSHTYAGEGNFAATVTVQDGAGANTTGAASIHVGYPFTVGAAADPTSGPAPLAVHFMGGADNGTPPYTYDWDFGDGSPHASTLVADHTYATAGTYTATFSAKDSGGAWRSKSLTISVETPQPLQVSATADTTSGTAPLAVTLTASASGGTAPYSYAWSFGDGESTSGNPEAHTYASAGSFTATVTATDSSTPAKTATASVTIQVTSPINPPLLSGVIKTTAPFRLKISGGNFHPDVKVYIGSDVAPWSKVVYKSSGLLVVKGGASLKARFAKGAPQKLTVVNGDGGSASIQFTR